MAEPLIKITGLFTADDKLTATHTFEWQSPFSIVLDFLVQPVLLQSQQSYEIMVQLVNWRTDPDDVGPWLGEDDKPRYTRDFSSYEIFGTTPEIPVKEPRTFRFKRTWPSFGAALVGLKNGQRPGVFQLRGTIRCIYHSIFDSAEMSPGFHFPGHPLPPAASSAGHGGGHAGIGSGKSGTS